MTLVHDYFHTRNLQQFQRLLDGAITSDRKQQAGAKPSTSGGKSWNRPGPLAAMASSSLDINARDWLGRTALHLACAAIENVEYVRALLKHPNINVNVPDAESHWTPLHRALYHSNLPAAQLLLQRSDIDLSLKDWEGYTAFDLYNSTINGTNPDPGQTNAELFTWGANRNAALGLGDGNDRAHPDQAVIQSKEDPVQIQDRRLSDRFTPISVRQIQMSKLHTVIVTSEDSGNLRVCGFGSGGRLGPGQHTQYSFKPLAQFNSTVTAVALGQDHTLALTKAGEVLSWGLNRFSQLGYVLETTTGKHEEPIQPTPKKIVGPLKKQIVIGVAASKVASACWTADEVFTWGTNTGQLGYDKNAQPVQILPRKVTKFSQPIIALALTDNAMVGLLQTQQVECVWNDRHYRINFPMQAFPSEIQPSRPRRAIKDSHIAKVTSCGDMFAALSSNGEVFTFSPPTDGGDAHDGSSRDFSRSAFKPQRVWALRKKFSAVRDVALGADGSIIICTESGHVYVRIRTAKGAGKNFKFQRIPYLQRVTQVCANSTGAFGALRVDFKPRPIVVQGPSIAEDLARMQPYRRPFPAADIPPGYRTHPDDKDLVETGSGPLATTPTLPPDDDAYADEETDDLEIEKDIKTLQAFFQIIKREERKVGESEEPVDYTRARLPQDADTLISSGDLTFPVHRVVLAMRSTVWGDILAGKEVSCGAWEGDLTIHLNAPRPGPGGSVLELASLSVKGIHPLSLLILLHYLYADEVLAIWDRRIHVGLAKQASGLMIDVTKVRADLKALADALELPHLAQVLQAPVKRAPVPSLSNHLSTLFDDAQDEKKRGEYRPFAPDVVLEFEDREVWTYSVVLRARSDFFAGLFGERVWTEERWSSDGVLRVDLKHLRWHVMEFVMRFLLCGKDVEMFEVLPFAKTVDDVLELMFEVMAAAAELLLDRLILICSSVILSHLTIHNCCYILAEATYYHAYQLINSVQQYMAANMESLLELGMLDDLPYYLIKQLSKFVHQKQSEKSSFTRTGAYLDELIAKHWDWLDLQDIPAPFVRSAKRVVPKGERGDGGDTRTTKLWPVPKELSATVSVFSPSKFATPTVHRRPSGDDLFAMDMGESGVTQPTASVGPAWKVTDAPRVDMRTLMAEAQQTRPPEPGVGVTSPRYPISRTPSGSAPSPIHGSGWNVPPAPSTPTKPAAQSPGPSWRQHPSPQIGLGSPAPATPGPGAPKLPPPLPSPLRTPANAPAAPPIPGMGPTFTPTRQLTSKSSAPGLRNVSAGGKAWTAPPPEPAVNDTPAPGSQSSRQQQKAMSFAAIQEAQQRQMHPVKDRSSLKEIQEEEEAVRAEANFLKWWEAEESRVREEMAALERLGQGGGSGGGVRGGGSDQKTKGKGKGKSQHRHRDGHGHKSKKPSAPTVSADQPSAQSQQGTSSSNPNQKDVRQPRQHRRPPNNHKSDRRQEQPRPQGVPLEGPGPDSKTISSVGRTLIQTDEKSV